MTPEPSTSAVRRADSSALRFVDAVDRIVAFVAALIGVLSIVAIFLALMADVVVRYFSTRGLGWPAEMPNILFPWLIMGGVVLAAHRGSHIAVPILLQAMNRGVARITLVAMQLVIIATFAFLSWVAIDVIKITGNQLFPITRVPQLYAYSAMIFGFGGIAVTAAITLVRVLFAEDPRELNTDSGENTI